MAECNKKCEVYSRVVGYYRPVDHWNSGKQEEFKDRLEYSEQIGLNKNFSSKTMENEATLSTVDVEVPIESTLISKYKVFSLPNCTKCTEVKAHLATIQALSGTETSLGNDDGVKEFRQYYKDIKDRVQRNSDGSLPIPTVLFLMNKIR